MKLVLNGEKWAPITLALVVDSIAPAGEETLIYLNPPKRDGVNWLFTNYDDVRYTRQINGRNRGFHWDNGYFRAVDFTRNYGEFLCTTPNDSTKKYANLIDASGSSTRSSYVSFKGVVLKYKLQF
jgi:hypothetical protein